MSKKKTKHALRSILIPNRGEIALRIVRSARALGLRTIVAHSEADADSPAVRLADDAVLLGPAAARESYLSIDRIVEAAKSTDADAVHPGYGFLSERESFARAVEDAGLAFIGPSPENIALMGDKVRARSTLAAAGVPIVPGDETAIKSVSELSELADRVGLPLLLKAAAGGGGKGIRLVRERDELEPAFQLARSEAENAFGDATLFAERFLERARHVEVQVLGDGDGGARIYPERDCSIQRRHQKLIEETPSPALDERLRERLLGFALTAVQSSRYRGAGTLEFLFDGEDGLYFLEMNTRLQVEHPVTECVTGDDLVAGQIEVARGVRFESRTLDEARLPARGAAIELRINAEDPAAGFLPSTGILTSVELPGGPGIRVDSAAVAGAEITAHYDSLIAKLIAWAPDRSRAIERLRVACEETVIRGVATTIPVGLALLSDAAFRSGDHHCQYLDSRVAEPGYLAPEASDELAIALAVAAAAEHGGLLGRRSRATSDTSGPAADLSPWARLGRAMGVRGHGR